MTKAYSYIRFSDPSQAEGDSYRRQLADTLAYCKAKGLELVSDSEYMYFDPGVSGWSGKLRDDDTELSRFLLNVKENKIPPGSTLIIESLDRLSREHVRKALPRFMDLLEAGIDIHTLHSGKTYTREYDEFDLFQSIMEMSRSHKESLWKSQRVASRWQQKQEQARNGVPLGKTKPAWLDLVYANGDKLPPTGFKPNDLVAVVEKIFQYTLDGYGRNVVARMLNDENIPTFKKNTNGWGASSIQQILTNQAVLGIYQPYTVIDGKREARGEPFMYYDPIIDQDTFAAARAATKGRDSVKARKQTPEYQIWQGLAKCQQCGSPMHTYGNGRKPKEGETAARWMRCYNAKKRKCPAGSISVQSIEPVFAEILAKLNILALVQSSASAINAKLEVVIGQLVAERAKLADITKHYTDTRSATLLALLLEAEAAVASLVAQEQQHIADLAADQIIDKADFFARLDLKSFPGRSRANSILKRLQVEVGINTEQRRFHVRKAGVPVFDFIDHPERGIFAYAATSELSGIIHRQDGRFSPLLRTDDDEEGDEEEFENEGYDSRDHY